MQKCFLVKNIIIYMKILNTKSKLNLLAAMVILLLFVACGKDDDATKPASNNAPFTFLKVGNEWMYQPIDDLNSIWGIRIVSQKNNLFITQGYSSYYDSDQDTLY